MRFPLPVWVTVTGEVGSDAGSMASLKVSTRVSPLCIRPAVVPPPDVTVDRLGPTVSLVLLAVPGEDTLPARSVATAE